MTYEEALKQIEMLLGIRSEGYYTCLAHGGETDEMFEKEMESFEVAIECLKNNIWHRTAVEKPIIEKEYLCCTIDERYRIKTFRVLCWANDLYEVDNFDFADKRWKSGFYYYDSEYGYTDCDCTYWKELDWSDEE